MDNLNISPTEAKIMFKKKFKNIQIDTKEISSYIETKYREASKINKENMGNYKSIIDIRDNDGNKITNIICNNDVSEENISEKDHFILIGTDDILANLKDNLMDQYFMDCTYSAVPPSIYKYKLLFQKKMKKVFWVYHILY